MTSRDNRAPLNLGFLSPHNPFDRRSFSGTAFYAAAALRRYPGVSLKILGDHRPPRLSNWLLGRPCPKIEEVSLSEFAGLDAVVSLVGSKVLGPLLGKLDVPFVHVTDATPIFLRECYAWNVPPEADTLEANVAKHAAAMIYSSAEMAERAADEFEISPYHAPFGVNLGAARRPKTCPKKEDMSKLQLLFVGNDWERKGGDIAVSSLHALQRMGIDAQLTIVGHAPKYYGSDPDISIAGYLNKNKTEQAAKLSQLYEKAHLLLVPSRADCTPMVIAEAMANGTPSIASDVGGVASLVGGAGTGKLMSVAADADQWAREIANLTANQFAYQAMSDACFDRANSRLTWRAWCRDLLRIIEEVTTTNVVQLPERHVAA
ncbi:MAG: glycosyltransferase family 4 protein [Pseudomonadota bacterium]